MFGMVHTVSYLSVGVFSDFWCLCIILIGLSVPPPFLLSLYLTSSSSTSVSLSGWRVTTGAQLPQVDRRGASARAGARIWEEPVGDWERAWLRLTLTHLAAEGEYIYHQKHHERLLPWSSICLLLILSQMLLLFRQKQSWKEESFSLSSSEAEYPACLWAMLHNQEHQHVQGRATSHLGH